MTGRKVIVKICGLGGVGDLEAANGADMIGAVIDVPSSPRNRTWEEAKVLFEAAQGRFRRVAVMVDPPAGSVTRALGMGADLVQIHGAIPQGLTKVELHRVFPSIPVPARSWGTPSGPGRPDLPVPEGELFPFIHLDVTYGDSRGGTGVTSDWTVCHRLVGDHRDRHFLLGGGLTPLNVVSAIREVGAAGVDVSTGVESLPGVKSPVKVAQFIRVVRSWEERHA